METYSFLRELADSWVLLAMFTFFVGVILWAFRPGSTRVYDEVAQIPLREDTVALVASASGGQSNGSTDGQTTLKGNQDV